MTHRPDVVPGPSERLRVRPWRADAEIAQISPPPGRPPGRDALAVCLDDLARRGYHAVITSALTAPEAFPFIDSGFTPHQHLVLLRHHLSATARPQVGSDTDERDGSSMRLRRARRRDTGTTLAIDRRAFDNFWHLDSLGLIEARTATTSNRWRVATIQGAIVGYAVTGRTGPVTYLQRLAVDPDAQGNGVGSALVLDALGWARHHRCNHLLVNTQEDNASALRLYERLGFERQPDGLIVWHRFLESHAR